MCLYDVDGGQRVVMLNMLTGVEDNVRGEGTHPRIPWLMQPKWYSIRLRPKLIQTTTGTKDLQMVTIHIRMLFKPDVQGLPIIHKTLGEDYDERVIPSIANEVMKATIAQYNAESLLTQREQESRNVTLGSIIISIAILTRW
ncbi:Prohibitin-1, mitochondrial [Symbiodinium microadriaticum]|uniref:Prohibitin n=1 Tax=Symbiodinium microadriaticum TaxID=2951 RepID=A0A1Q9E6M5_SYMMI|nr:Prohibitin-1, mitochondrial [Symbiodinium microadriaticum]